MMNKFKWKKKGIIFNPVSRYEWMNTHAQVPYTLAMDGDILRVYFSTREAQDINGNFKSYSAYVDLDINNFDNIINVSQKPIINLGGSGEFDEFGSMAGSVCKHDNEYWLYYCGWQRSLSTPYNWAIGLAKSNDKGDFFRKIGPGPIVGPAINEPYLQACPIVYKFSESTCWHMFYLSGVKWINVEGNKKESQYLIMHATSKDGVSWNRSSKAIIEPLVDDECQTSSSIFYKDGFYHMFFSYRHGVDFRVNKARGYRIGYAYSSDLANWKRDDSLAGIDVSEKGWDSEMIAYPHVFTVAGKYFMLYCGNDFGKNGFGYAALEE